jgi:hypothetical protein
MATPISDWTDRIERMRVGWTIRLKNGSLARITWIAPLFNTYMAEEIKEASRGGEEAQ